MEVSGKGTQAVTQITTEDPSLPLGTLITDFIHVFKYNSWPAEGRPRPKVPILGGVYMFTQILRRARKNVAVEFSYYL